MVVVVWASEMHRTVSRRLTASLAVASVDSKAFFFLLRKNITHTDAPATEFEEIHLARGFRIASQRHAATIPAHGIHCGPRV